MPNTAASKSFIHVVAGIIRHPKNQHKLFITRRQQGQHLENLWEFPGGKLEPNESRFHALRRELEEENGIQVTSALPFFCVLHEYPDKNIFLDVWEVKSYLGKAHGREGQQARWVKQTELDELDFPAADIPIIKALTLPGKLLITPDLSEPHQDVFIDHFRQLMQRHPYPLVQFRSHHLDDQYYAEIALQLQDICDLYGAEVIISRPRLKSLKSDRFKAFRWRHLNSNILQSLVENPFDDSIQLSAACHDRAELKKAERLDCQFALLSTIRQTLSHPGRQAKGWYQFNLLARQANLPIYALGGVTRKDLCVARLQGGIGVAGIADFWTV